MRFQIPCGYAHPYFRRSTWNRLRVYQNGSLIGRCRNFRDRVFRITFMTHSDLALSLARRSDALAIAKMSRVLIEYGLQWKWTAQRVEASIRAANVNVLVARLDTRIIGFAIMRYGDDDAHLDLLAVAPPYRRLGVAQQLLQWLEKCATVAGTFRITLEVRENNRDAQRFYERMGYQRLSVVPGYYQGSEAAVRMSRNLACEAPKQQDAEH